MKTTSLRRWLTALVAGTAFLLPSAASLSAKEVVKINFFANENDEDFDGSMVFKDYVESRSNGEIEVQVYPNGGFCSKDAECLDAIQSGALEIYITTIGGFGNVYGPAQVMDLPYMFPDDRVAECVFDGPFTHQLRVAVLDEGIPMRLMAISNTGGWRNIANTKRQIRSPQDVKGLKVRTIKADVQIELVKAMGGNPTPISWPEVYTSLATGVVDGTKNGITDIVGMKFHEHLKHITLDGHAYMGALWFFSEARWQQFPAAHQRILFDGFQHLKSTARAFPMRKQVPAYEDFKKAGGTIYVPTPAEKEAFKAAAAPVYDWYKGKFGDEWLIKLENAVAQCNASVTNEFLMATQPKLRN
ncbi:MAG: TRAP transporter substrate-binding protein DctP [bacterium]